MEKSAESIVEQLDNGQNSALAKQTRVVENFGNIALSGFGVVLLTGIGAFIYFIFEKMILTGANVLAGILIVACLIFAVLSLIFVYLNESNREKKEKTNRLPNDRLTTKRETGKLLIEAPFEIGSSVTENSTELIGVENKTRKFY